jgi:flagellar FliL protein
MSEPTKPDPEVAAMAATVRPSRVVPALIAMNSLMLVGVMAFLAMQSSKSSGPPPAEHEVAEEPKAEQEDPKAEKKEGEGNAAKPVKGVGPLVKLADFVIHLRNPEIDRYARLSFDVEVISDADREQLNAHMPRVRDAFISYLSDRTLEELQGAEGLGRTKEALQGRIRDLVPEARVRSLYISDFVVQ